VVDWGFDGYRCLAGKTEKGIELWSRRGNLYTQQFRGIATASKVLERDTLIDGELVALDENGRPSFSLLQHFRSKASPRARGVLFNFYF
jgi:bifunctional non-homologous end joining protein LigD